MVEYFDTFEDACNFVRQYEEETNSKFVIKKKKKLSVDVQKKRIFWEDPKKEVVKGSVLSYDGTPFLIQSLVVLNCRHGLDKNKARKARNALQQISDDKKDHVFKKKRFLVQNSIKSNCTASVFIREICRFPQFKIDVDTPRRRSYAGTKLKAAMQSEHSDDIVRETRFYVKLPNVEDHVNHIVGEAAAVKAPIDQRVKNFILQQVGEGIISVAEVVRQSNLFVKSHIFAGQEMPSRLSRRFFPTRKDVSNIIFRARVANMHSRIDQDNLNVKIALWQQQYPGDSFYFRPFVDSTRCVADDSDEVAINSEGRSGLLVVYQSAWQKQMLRKYGDLCLMDATYKTCRYAVPLFFLCVRTNVDYAVVAMFVTQFEDSASIVEALKILQTWNPAWSPASFMVDFSDAEINSLETVFPGSRVYICDFHREQCWLRWTSLTKHGVTSVKDDLLRKLRQIAQSPTVEAYNVAVQALKTSSVWKEHELLRQWFEKTWLPEHRRWAYAFRSVDFHVKVNTNNGVERQNRALKYDYLTSYRDSTITGLLTVLIDKFFPDAYRKYVLLNVRFCDAYRQYNQDLPAFLHNRPRDFVKHVCSRWASARDYSAELIQEVDDRTFVVMSADSGKRYTVCFGTSDNDMPYCECEDWQRYHWPCKHFCAIFQNTPHGWDELSKCYRDSPYFSLDDDIINGAGFSNFNDQEAATLTDCMEGELPGEPELNTSVITEVLDAKTPEQLASQCRETLRQLLDATFLCSDVVQLQHLHDNLEAALSHVRNSMPGDGGLLLNLPVKTPISDKRHYSSCNRQQKRKRMSRIFPSLDNKKNVSSQKGGYKFLLLKKLKLLDSENQPDVEPEHKTDEQCTTDTHFNDITLPHPTNDVFVPLQGELSAADCSECLSSTTVADVQDKPTVQGLSPESAAHVHTSAMSASTENTMQFPPCDFVVEDSAELHPPDDTALSATNATFGLSTKIRELKLHPKLRLSVGDYNINVKDLRTLLPGLWISDAVINAYLQLLMWHNVGQVFCIPSHICLAWQSSNISHWLYRKVCFSVFKYILVPFLHGSHWMLMVANVQRKTVGVLSSVKSPTYTNAAEMEMQNWIRYMKLRCHKVKEPLDITSWTMTNMRSTLQEDGYNCGVFVMMNAEAIVTNFPITSLACEDISSRRGYIFSRLYEASDRQKMICAADGCKQPKGHAGIKWIMCDQCQRWFHFVCVGVHTAPETYYCNCCAELLNCMENSTST